MRFSLDDYEILIDLTEAPEHHTHHGAKKFDPGVLFLFRSIGLDYLLLAKLGSHSGKHRILRQRAG